MAKVTNAAWITKAKAVAAQIKTPQNLDAVLAVNLATLAKADQYVFAIRMGAGKGALVTAAKSRWQAQIDYIARIKAKPWGEPKKQMAGLSVVQVEQLLKDYQKLYAETKADHSLRGLVANFPEAVATAIKASAAYATEIAVKAGNAAATAITDAAKKVVEEAAPSLWILALGYFFLSRRK